MSSQSVRGATFLAGRRSGGGSVARTAFAVTSISLVAGFTATLGLGFGLAAVALAAGLVVIQTVSTRSLLMVLIAATFVTRFRITVAGFHMLPEQFAAALLLLVLIRDGKTRAIHRAIADRTVLLLATFILWEAVVTLVQAPDPAKGLHIVGWLCLDWLLLIAILASRPDSGDVERVAAICTALVALIALLLWLAHIGAGSALGTQGGYAGGGRAVFGLSWEANILASTVAVWGFVALSSHDERVRRVALVATPLAIGAVAVSYTRAALIGFALAVLVWLASGDWLARLRVLRLATVIASAGLALGLVHQVATPVEARFANLLALHSGTGALRVGTVQTALGDLHGLNPFVGLGVESFGQRHFDPTMPGRPGYIGELPLQILYESGVVGVALLGAAFASVRPFARKNAGRALGIVAVYLTAASATSPLWLGWTWLLVGLAIMTRPRSSHHRAAS
jgi:O-antigen ligase